MGAGPSTAVVTLFFKHFSEIIPTKQYTFKVEQRSIKHAGGITASDKYLFGRTGRPLNQKEKALNKRELFLARIPLTMVSGNQTRIKKITLEQLEKIFTQKITNWNQLGGADHKITLVGREDTEAALNVLTKTYPFFTHANYDKKLTRDHQVVNFIKSNDGDYALAFGAISNFDEQYHLTVEGFEAGINLGLVYDANNASHTLVESARIFAKSETWTDIVRKNGFLPAETN